MYFNITNESDEYFLYDPQDNCFMRGVETAADFCLKSRIFSVLTLGHLHTLVHEMGHAVAHSILTGGAATINLSTKNCYGSTTFHSGPRPLSSAGATWIDLSGPLADIIFSVVLIIGIFALTHYVSMPQAVSLGLRIAISAPAVLWIVGEFFYAGLSASRRDEGDFGKIVNRGVAHFVIAIAILISICALCALGIALLL